MGRRLLLLHFGGSYISGVGGSTLDTMPLCDLAVGPRKREKKKKKTGRRGLGRQQAVAVVVGLEDGCGGGGRRRTSHQPRRRAPLSKADAVRTNVLVVRHALNNSVSLLPR